MEKSNEHIYNVGIRVLLKRSSAAEEEELRQWLEASPANREEFEKMRQLGQDIQAVPVSQEEFDVDTAWHRVDSVLQQEERTAPGAESGPRRIKTLVYMRWAAAAAVLVLAIAGGWWFLMKSSLHPHSLSADKGKIERITLEDGSVVTLRQGATITYDKGFGNENRAITLRGDAYFEVQEQAGLPFVVHTTGRLAVEVLGTAFSVNTSGEQASVVVVSGKVKLSAPDKLSPPLVLTAGEKGEYNNGTLLKQFNEDKNFLSWKTGILQFKDAALSDVLEGLGQFYGRKLRIDDSYLEAASDQKVSIEFNLGHSSLEEALKELQLLHAFNYRLQKDTYIIYR